MPRGTFRVGEDAFPLRQYVSRRVDVAVVVRTARRAVPRPHRQRQGVEPVPAGRAGLARRVEAADLDKGAPMLGALVLKQLGNVIFALCDASRGDMDTYLAL